MTIYRLISMTILGIGAVISFSSFAVQSDCSSPSIYIPSDREFPRNDQDDMALTAEQRSILARENAKDQNQKSRERAGALNENLQAYFGYKWFKGEENKLCETGWNFFEDENGVIHCQHRVTTIYGITDVRCGQDYIEIHIDRPEGRGACVDPMVAYTGEPAHQVCVLNTIYLANAPPSQKPPQLASKGFWSFDWFK